jgi:hypothetical protein
MYSKMLCTLSLVVTFVYNTCIEGFNVTGTPLLLTLVGVSLALRLAGKATLVGCAECPLFTGVSKVAILLSDGLRCVCELVRDLVGSLIEISDAVGSALSGRWVLHVVVRKALGLGSHTALRGLAECALLAGVCEVGFFLCH